MSSIVNDVERIGFAFDRDQDSGWRFLEFDDSLERNCLGGDLG